MYTPHPSCELNDLFARKPFQGAAPDKAEFLFVGLDANYSMGIEACPVFSKILEYHADGVAFWQSHGVHHPFLLPGYSGSGRFYHLGFAGIGFRPEHANLVSFLELLPVPTVGRNLLVGSDLAPSHLKMLTSLIMDGPAQHIFLPSAVRRLMRSTGIFPWLPRTAIGYVGPLGILLRNSRKTVYSHLHFSVFGKFEKQKRDEALAIRGLLPQAA